MPRTLGVVEWVDHTAPLRDAIKDAPKAADDRFQQFIRASVERA